ncbi:hypothetical protein NKG94_02985 [Micromonospora sp. M12]
MQQWMADDALQLAQLLAEGGLGMPERDRGAADAAGPDGGDERPEQGRFEVSRHKRSLCQPQRNDHFLWAGASPSVPLVTGYRQVLAVPGMAPLLGVSLLARTAITADVMALTLYVVLGLGLSYAAAGGVAAA